MDWDRERYLLSQWHILEFVRIETEEKGRPGVNSTEIIRFFKKKPEWMLVKINNLLSKQMLTTIPGKRGRIYTLSREAKKFMEKYHMTTFLHENNPRLKKSKMIAEKLRKQFISVME